MDEDINPTDNQTTDNPTDLNINYDETVYQVLNDRYLVEWQRTTNIENKAICIIGFIGVLMVFSVSFGLEHFTDFSGNYSILKIYILCIFSLIFAFIFSLKALFIGNKRMRVLDTDYILYEYVSRNKPFLKETYQELREEIYANNTSNIIKNFCLSASVYAFVFSCLALFMFTVWYVYLKHSNELFTIYLHYANMITNILT
ncbi:hypothetical protein A9239_13620 [Methanosarcina sp. A14]|uniref:Uncharacterized protein n=1 Tax=Methanosarcina barkeri MS TaxID=1434108 RepID=A0A0E3LNL0_METBA|nr:MULTISPECIES: hypothetical protein [Methanosarcina]AKB54956.1 hypothetical protein MSBRM_1958 [Methanosarcina barkeri MS]OED03506.1 hypothetical protein A9239_13620 [Methanosarcina sp. A14]